jgi:hypothetical protein
VRSPDNDAYDTERLQRQQLATVLAALVAALLEPLPFEPI